MQRVVGIVLIAVAVAACGTRGSGTIVDDVRDVAGFERIDLRDAVVLDLVVDPSAAQSIVVRYDDNLLPQIVTRLEGSTLVIEMDGSVSVGSGDRAVVVTTDRLESLEVSGASTAKIAGAIDRLSLDVAGASTVDASDLRASTVELDVSGASTVVVFASTSVDGSVSGASTVRILGGPTVDVDESGASTVRVEGG